MITRFSEVIRRKLGWCPDTATMRTTPEFLSFPPEANPSAPDGGAGGAERIGRGISLAVGSVKILIRNKRLLWFSVLTGLIGLISGAGIEFSTGINPFPATMFNINSGMILMAKGALSWGVLTYVIILLTSLFSYVLLAGLILCVTLILSGKDATIGEGLALAGKHVRRLSGWAVACAVIATAENFILIRYFGMAGIFSFKDLLINFVVTSGNFIFIILTMFVVPVLVLENKGLFDAIADSVSLFRIFWKEITVYAVIFGLIFLGVLLTAPAPGSLVGFSTDISVFRYVTGTMYLFAISVPVIVISTVTGILLTGLYICAKTDRLPELFLEK